MTPDRWTALVIGGIAAALGLALIILDHLAARAASRPRPPRRVLTCTTPGCIREGHTYGASRLDGDTCVYCHRIGEPA